jgi:hypothetical protein
LVNALYHVKILRRLLLLLVMMTLCSSPVFADATAFIGTDTTPSNRQARGFAAGFGLFVFGFEFEYSKIVETETPAPALQTLMGNVLVQTPGTFLIPGIQFYLTMGAGGYTETLGARQVKNIGFNSGGGVKVSLAGPIRVRLDYRIFRLRGDALYPTSHRLYGGLNLSF